MRKSDLFILTIFVLIVIVIGFSFSSEQADGLLYSFNPVSWVIDSVMGFLESIFKFFFG